MMTPGNWLLVGFFVLLALLALLMMAAPEGEISYRSDAYVVGHVPQEIGVTTYGCQVGGLWALLEGRAEPRHFCRQDSREGR